MKLPNHTIMQYIRKRGQKAGVILAIKTEKGFSIGYSMCHQNDLNSNPNRRLDVEHAISLAIGRAYMWDGTVNGMPHAIRKRMHSFIERCNRYYRAKTKNIANRQEDAWETLNSTFGNINDR